LRDGEVLCINLALREGYRIAAPVWGGYICPKQTQNLGLMSVESVAKAEASLSPVSKQDGAGAVQELGNPRVLIIDDTRSIHDDFRKILTAAPRPAFEELESALFDSPAPKPRAQFTLDSAYQGPEGLELVQRALAQGGRYALAFIDVRMPPGWDGLETVSRLWAVDPDIQVVICSAYSDYSWSEMMQRLGQTDNLLLLKKPFDATEVVQVAHALTRKWVLLQQAKGRLEDLDRTIARRTHDLYAANEQLRQEITQREHSEERLAAFSTLGKRLSAAQTAKEAAQIIVEVADQLLGWDACMCDLYSAATNLVSPLLLMDVIDGQRRECTMGGADEPPTASVRQAIEAGGFLRLREVSAGMRPVGLPFGDVARPSVSSLFVPIRNGVETHGVLSIQSYTLNAYDEQSLKTLQDLADHCGGALARLRSREALLASEANHRALVERMPDAILVHVDQKFVYANPAALHFVGARNLEQLLGRLIWDIVPPELQKLVASRVGNSARGRANRTMEQQIVRLDGTRLDVEVTSLPFTYEGKAAVQTVMRDITARKRAEEVMRASEERFRSVWESSLDGMRLTDREGRILAVNGAYCQLLKLPREKLVGELFSVAYKSHGPKDGLDVYQQRFDSGTIIPRVTARVQFWNCEEAELEISSSFIELGRHKMVLAIFRDVTERKQLEQQLRHSQKMEAIGQLAGGVAHDFNNLLAVIRGNTELVLMKEEQLPESAGECLQQVVTAADRAAGLTRQLLAFSRKQVMQAQPLNLNDVIGNFTKMLKRIIGEDIQLQCNYAARLPLVRADAAMLEQVLVNLVINARDAMPRGGQLVVATELVTLDAASLKLHPEARLGDFVTLSVRDTGAGIAPEHLPHVFEPFFTTKEVGKGTGLGLATVYGIAKQHGGWVEVASTLGAGATFKLFLQVFAAAAPAPAPAPAQPNPGRGTETVLLVEDDEAVRSLTRRLLESFGYQVHEAASGVRALEVWRAQAEHIDLLLTDMVMPEGVNGRELAEQLLAQRSRLKVVFMTGYSPNVAGKDTQFLRRQGSAFLQKPCHWRDLLQTIRRLLDMP
jgi:PAS domain S-box-containing protein